MSLPFSGWANIFSYRTAHIAFRAEDAAWLRLNSMACWNTADIDPEHIRSGLLSRTVESVGREKSHKALTSAEDPRVFRAGKGERRPGRRLTVWPRWTGLRPPGMDRADGIACR